MAHTVHHFDFTKDIIQRYPFINPAALDALVNQYETHIEFESNFELEPLFCYVYKDAQSHCKKILCWLLSELSEKQFDSLIHKKIIDRNDLLYIFISIISAYEEDCFEINSELTYVWLVIKRIIARMSPDQFIQRFKLSGYSKQEKKWIIEEFNMLAYLMTVFFTREIKTPVLAPEFMEVFGDLLTKNEYFSSDEFESQLSVFCKTYDISL